MKLPSQSPSVSPNRACSDVPQVRGKINSGKQVVAEEPTHLLKFRRFRCNGEALTFLVVLCLVSSFTEARDNVTNEAEQKEL